MSTLFGFYSCKSYHPIIPTKPLQLELLVAMNCDVQILVELTPMPIPEWFCFASGPPKAPKQEKLNDFSCICLKRSMLIRTASAVSGSISISCLKPVFRGRSPPASLGWLDCADQSLFYNVASAGCCRRSTIWVDKFFQTLSVQTVKAEFFLQRIGLVLAKSHRLTAPVLDEKTECFLFCQGRGCQIQAQPCKKDAMA